MMKFMDAFSGRGQSRASQEAADIQLKSAKRALGEYRSDLNPYVQAGYGAADDVRSLVGDPQAQMNLLANSPVFKSMLEQQNRGIMAQQAARGKMGSGDTRAAIQRGTIGLGGQFIDDQIGRYMPLLNQGQYATANLADRGSQLMTDAANAEAAGVMGQAAGSAQGAQNMTTAASTIMSIFSDESLKKKIFTVGYHNELPVYTWEWNDKAKDVGLEGGGYGHLAQEVKAKHPELVSETSGGLMKVDYSTKETVEAILWR